MSDSKNKQPQSTWEQFKNWVNGEEAEHQPIHIKPVPAEVVEAAKRAKNKIIYEETKQKKTLYTLMCIGVCVVFIGILLMTVYALPDFGSSNNPASNEVVERYVESGMEETGAVNIVAGMILDYRAFDTFGESCVLFLSVICVVILIKRDKYNISAAEDQEIAEDEEFDRQDENLIIKRTAALLVPMIFLYGIYVILNGHLSPGGGFSGGAIVGAGLILYSSAFGSERVRSFFTFKTFTGVSVACLLTYCGAKSYSFFTGANHLHSIIPKGTPGNILSAGLILPLNICVGFVVACTMYGFYALFTKGDI